jgi:hypothetical protein
MNANYAERKNKFRCIFSLPYTLIQKLNRYSKMFASIRNDEPNTKRIYETKKKFDLFVHIQQKKIYKFYNPFFFGASFRKLF